MSFPRIPRSWISLSNICKHSGIHAEQVGVSAKSADAAKTVASICFDLFRKRFLCTPMENTGKAIDKVFARDIIDEITIFQLISVSNGGKKWRIFTPMYPTPLPSIC